MKKIWFSAIVVIGICLYFGNWFYSENKISEFSKSENHTNFTEDTNKQAIAQLTVGEYLAKLRKSIGRRPGGGGPTSIMQTQFDITFDTTENHLVNQIHKALVQARALRADHTSTGQAADEPEWQAAGPTNFPGRILDVAVHPSAPNTIYAGSATGGVFKSTDLGQSWNAVFDEIGALPVNSVTIDPSDPNTIYVGTGEPTLEPYSVLMGEGVFKSSNGGETWVHLGLEKTLTIGKIIVDANDPNRIFVAAQGRQWLGNTPDRGVYRSEDGGTTWTKVLYISPVTGCVDLAYHPSSGVLLATTWQYPWGTGSGVWRSDDRGDSWTDITGTNGLPGHHSTMSRVTVTMGKTHQTAYVAFAGGLGAETAGAFNGLYKSTDLGLNWTRTNADQIDQTNAWIYKWGVVNWGGVYFGGPQVSPTNPDRVLIMGYWVNRSTDGGVTWDRPGSGYPWWGSPEGIVHVDQHALCFLETDDDVIYLANDGGIYYSDDLGDNWLGFFNMANNQINGVAMAYTYPERLFGGARDHCVLATRTGLVDDYTHIGQHDGVSVCVDYTNPEIIYTSWTAFYSGALYKSEDGGVSVREVSTGINPSEPSTYKTVLVMDENDPQVLYTVTDRVYKTANGADSWQVISPRLSAPASNCPIGVDCGTLSTVAPARSDGQVVYAGGAHGRVWVTLDGGANWNYLSSTLPDVFISRITVDPYDAAIAYVTQSSYITDGETVPRIHRTTDYGQTWTAISGNLPDAPINDVIVDYFNDSTLYIGTDVGVFWTTNLGQTWTIYGTGLPLVIVTDLAYHPPTKMLVAGTYGRSIFKITTECNDPTDSDGDGICNAFDNCPNTPNADQADADLDLVGNICDDCYDTDRDNYGNPGYDNDCPDDNCPDTYNPNQLDSDDDGKGDACDYDTISVAWDTISTDCTAQAIGSNGSLGRPHPPSTGGISMDYYGNGDCEENDRWYLSDGSPVIAYRNLETDITHTDNLCNEADDFLLPEGLGESDTTKSTDEYEVLSSGIILTSDSTFGFEVTSWAPSGLDNCHFIVQRKKVFKYRDIPVESIRIGDAINWQIPSSASKNIGGVDADYNLVYQQGQNEIGDPGCRDNETRFGGMSLLGYYYHDSDTVHTDAYSGFVERRLVYDWPYHQFVPSEMMVLMSQAGFRTTPFQEDIFSVLTYVADPILEMGDTLYVYSVITSLLDGTIDNLGDNIDRARNWVAECLGIDLFVDGDANGDGSVNVGDVVYLTNHIFHNGPAPNPNAAGDANCDGMVNIGDAVYLINHIFKVGPGPC